MESDLRQMVTATYELHVLGKVTYPSSVIGTFSSKGGNSNTCLIKFSKTSGILLTCKMLPLRKYIKV